eukprot:scaffold1128_cov348-Pavlova_lutheri.AAC.6
MVIHAVNKDPLLRGCTSKGMQRNSDRLSARTATAACRAAIPLTTTCSVLNISNASSEIAVT